jgi:SAM-dependent methyltransferase
MKHETRPVTSEPSAVFRHLDDESWFEVLVRSIDEPIIDGAALPRFPGADFQIGTIGSSGRQALAEACHFWKVVRRYADRAGIRMDKGTRVLDFGCGWGRMVRFFLRDLAGEDVYGADVGLDMITLCREHFRTGHFELVQPTPPTRLPRASFDVVYAYSVFSHLNEAVSLAWIEELTATLKPGGLLIVTTQARRFITRCEEIRRDGKPGNPWEESLSRLFTDQMAALEAYDGGQFVHVATGGGDYRPASFYGESVIPRDYVDRVWSRFLEPVDFVDDPSQLGQALIVMRKSGRRAKSLWRSLLGRG